MGQGELMRLLSKLHIEQLQHEYRYEYGEENMMMDGGEERQ